MPSRDPPVPVQAHLSDDPLDAVLRPPIDETEEEKAHRLAIEEEARRISQEIDEAIREEKALRKKSKAVRLLLLGQSESGESTKEPFAKRHTTHRIQSHHTLYPISFHDCRQVHDATT